MNYLERIKALENTKQTKKVCIFLEAKELTGTKETKDTKEVMETDSVSESLLPPHALPTPPPEPTAFPEPGWLVAYRGTDGQLYGGCDDRDHGTVARCDGEGRVRTVILTDGQRLPLQMIRSIGKTDGSGRVIAAWTVKGCGYDGEGGRG